MCRGRQARRSRTPAVGGGARWHRHPIHTIPAPSPGRPRPLDASARVAAAIAKAGLPAAIEGQITVTEDATTATLSNGRLTRLDATTLAVTGVTAASGRPEGATTQAPGCALQTEFERPVVGN